MQKSVEVRGLREAMRELDALGKGNLLRDKVSPALDASATRILEKAKQLVPFKTGALKRSLQKRFRKAALSAKVIATYPKGARRRVKKTKKQAAGSQGYYAFAVEFGTKTKKAKPFLFPAARSCATKNDAEINLALDKVLDANARR